MEKTTLYRVVGWDDMNPVQLALANADIHLSAIHGVLMKSDFPDMAEDNLKVHQLINNANDWLEEQGFLVLTENVLTEILFVKSVNQR